MNIIITPTKIGWTLRAGVLLAAILGIIGLLCQSFFPHLAQIFLRSAIVVLVDLQVVRVFLTVGLFINERRWCLVICSALILLSMIWTVRQVTI